MVLDNLQKLFCNSADDVSRVITEMNIFLFHMLIIAMITRTTVDILRTKWRMLNGSIRSSVFFHTSRNMNDEATDNTPTMSEMVAK